MIAANAKPKTCPRCGGGFGCTVDGHCWCMDEPYRIPMPKPGESQYEGCLCKSCLRAVAEASGLAPPA